MKTIVQNLNAIIWSVYVLVPLLVLAAAYFSYKTRFVQLRFLPHTFKLLIGSNQKRDENSISSFQAFIVGLASRVGTGNLAGVAIALVTGGPGAIFWMWIAALLGSACAFVESTLAQLYKIPDEEKKYRGGPAYYISRALHNKTLAMIFAASFVAMITISISSIQANTITTSLANVIIPVFNVDPFTIKLIIAIILTLLTAYIIFGGAKKIVNYSTIVVSAMAVVYLLMSLFVMLMNITELPAIIGLIVSSAFNPASIAGGSLGGIISVGFKRGLFSNEAGLGSAPNAAASADVKHPIVQGLIQSLGALIDTIVICSMTAFIILISGVPLEGTDGITITQKALFTTMGEISTLILTISVVLFAFSTILGVFFYGQTNYEFLVPSKRGLNIYKLVVVGFVFVASLTDSELLWAMGDLGNGITALINICVILKLFKYVKILFNDYQSQLKAGIKEPVFDSREFEEFKHLDVWHQDKE